MPQIRILLIGRSPCIEGAIRAAFAEHPTDGAQLHVAPDLSTALERMTAGQSVPPDILLLAESRPGIWTDRELGRLRQAAPLARIVRLSGVWCEGQARSARPPAGSLSIAWHRLAVWLRRELLEQSARGFLSAPLTATSEDLQLAQPPRARSTKNIRIAIQAPRAAGASAWATMCQGLNYQVAIISSRMPSNSCADIVLWDCEPRDLADAAAVRRLIAAAAGKPVIALCGFARPDDVRMAQQQGVAAVLAKPLVVADFEWHVSRLAGAGAER
jgi:CheY-like chemotaxis protein